VAKGWRHVADSQVCQASEAGQQAVDRVCRHVEDGVYRELAQSDRGEAPEDGGNGLGVEVVRLRHIGVRHLSMRDRKLRDLAKDGCYRRNELPTGRQARSRDADRADGRAGCDKRGDLAAKGTEVVGGERWDAGGTQVKDAARGSQEVGEALGGEGGGQEEGLAEGEVLGDGGRSCCGHIWQVRQKRVQMQPGACDDAVGEGRRLEGAVVAGRLDVEEVLAAGSAEQLGDGADGAGLVCGTLQELRHLHACGRLRRAVAQWSGMGVDRAARRVAEDWQSDVRGVARQAGAAGSSG